MSSFIKGPHAHQAFQSPDLVHLSRVPLRHADIPRPCLLQSPNVSDVRGARLSKSPSTVTKKAHNDHHAKRGHGFLEQHQATNRPLFSSATLILHASVACFLENGELVFQLWGSSLLMCDEYVGAGMNRDLLLQSS